MAGAASTSSGYGLTSSNCPSSETSATNVPQWALDSTCLTLWAEKMVTACARPAPAPNPMNSTGIESHRRGLQDPPARIDAGHGRNRLQQRLRVGVLGVGEDLLDRP